MARNGREKKAPKMLKKRKPPSQGRNNRRNSPQKVENSKCQEIKSGWPKNPTQIMGKARITLYKGK